MGGVAGGSPVMSRYRSSCCSRRCSSCGVELRLFFTPGEDDELRREQGGAVAQAERRSLLRFMEAAAARQGTATMARQPGPESSSCVSRRPRPGGHTALAGGWGKARAPWDAAAWASELCGPRLPGTPRRDVPWSFIHKKEGPTTLLGARRLRPFIGQRGVTSRSRGLPTGRYPVTP